MSNDLEVENYETNLKLLYEAKRKELDILLTSSMPIQLSNMKTILWINFIMIGVILQFIKKFPMNEIMVGFFYSSSLAIIAILIAMLTSRIKSYGVNDGIDMMATYNDDKWTKSQALYDMLSTLQLSLEENRKALVKRGKLTNLATYFTFLSIIVIIISFIIKQLSS